jgi:hypothetical protein
MIKGIALVAALGWAFGASGQDTNKAAQKPKAEQIFIHGNVYTQVIDCATSLSSTRASRTSRS